MQEKSLNYIVVEGPPGTKKKHLTEYLCKKRGARRIMDNSIVNPFLKDFYRDKKRHAFTTQMAFMAQRYQILRNITKHDLFHDSIICNFLFQRSFVYSNILLDENELKLFNRISKFMRGNLPTPDLVIYIQADISMISRKEKTLFGDETLSSLCDAYNHFFFHYEDAPTLVIRPDQLNLNDENDLAEIDSFLDERITGTVYYSKGGELFT